MDSCFSKCEKTKQYKRAEYLLKVELLQTYPDELIEAKLIFSEEVESHLGEVKEFDSFDGFFKYSDTTMLRDKIREQIINKGYNPVWQIEKYVTVSGKREKIIKAALDMDYNIIAWLLYPEFEECFNEAYQKELYYLMDEILLMDGDASEDDTEYKPKRDENSILFGDLLVEEKNDKTYYHIYLGRNLKDGYGNFISTEGEANKNFVFDNVLPLYGKMRKTTENEIMKIGSMMLKSNPFELLYWRLHYKNTKLHYPELLDGHMAKIIRYSMDYAIKNDRFYPQI